MPWILHRANFQVFKSVCDPPLFFLFILKRLGRLGFPDREIAERSESGLNNPECGTCGAKMKGNGRTKAGARRWSCLKCRASSVRKHGSAAKRFELFLRWLLSNDAVVDLGVSRSTFWRRASWAWGIWPIAPFTGEVHDVVLLDDIWLRRKAVVFVAVAGEHVVGWHLARAECSSVWAALLLRTPALKMALRTDLPASPARRGRLAGDPHPALHIPCGEPGKAVHDAQA